MAGVKLTWKGPAIKALVDAAQQKAITATVADAAAQAQTMVPVDTGLLKNSLTFQAAQRRGSGWVGSFGSYSVAYAIYVELGTYKMSAQPYIRPSADRIFPSFPARIAEFGGG